MPDPSLLTPATIQAVTTLPIHGRHDLSCAESPYFLPNSLSECERLNLQHLILQMFFKRQFFVPFGQTPRQTAALGTGSWNEQVVERARQRGASAPAPLPARILDVGCGTGQWAIGMAQQFPNAQVVGLDIVSPARPFPAPLPPNFAFSEVNVLRGLGDIPDASFDFVHMRDVGQGIPAQQWQRVINELVRVTVPGGWIETVELSLPHDGGPAFTAIHAMIAQILTARGVDVAYAQRVDSYLRQATPGVQAISSHASEIPIGSAGGGHGTRMAWNVLLGFDNLAPFFVQTRCWDTATWKQLRAMVEAELNQPEHQPSMTVTVAMGQRR